MTLSFTKMHGLGNDFVVLDARRDVFSLTETAVRALAERRTGVGCDQVIVIEPPRSPEATAYMRIRNADGGEVGACGNATRCVAALLMKETGLERVVIETRAGLLSAQPAGGTHPLTDGVTVDMGAAGIDWREIPLAVPADTLHLDLSFGGLSDPVAVSMGNPHAVFFVDDVAAVPLEEVGSALEHHSVFPERANIEVAQILSHDRIRMRVWERGAGITRACGTGACAVLVAAVRRGLTGRKAEVILDGGSLMIEWRPDRHVLMTGPVAVSFTGRLAESWTR
ncbi:Diaminopimelate epimerase [Azospirillaceae bacterium]